MDCCAGANRLWIWPLRDGAVIPAPNMALVKGEQVSKDKTLLPLIETVLEHRELLVVMCRVLWTASFLSA